MTGAVWRRLLTMRPEELRGRLATEVRKHTGRVRASLSAPRWQREDLRRVVRGDADAAMPWRAAILALDQRDYRSAHAALAQHFSTRASAFPLCGRDAPALARALNRDFPAAAADAGERADRILSGRYDLLGYRGLDLGVSPDWHADVVHHRRAPQLFWANVPYLDPASGDHKIIWELNRQQHWLALGRCHLLTGDPRCYRVVTAQLSDWLGANPPGIGVNWASALELAFRSLSWLWALEIFAPAAQEDDEQPWLVDLLLALDRQLTHIEHNLSRYFSPNTHLTGEALALYVAGLSLPELGASARRAGTGRDILLQETRRQVLPDGGHAERSTHYHRYSTDFYLFATVVARRANDPAAARLEDSSRMQARVLRLLTDQRGIRPAIGDDDGGRLLPCCGGASEECADTLSTAAVLLDDPSLAVAPVAEHSYWICGPAAAHAAAERAGAQPATWPSADLRDTGYLVSRTVRGDHLIFDAGAHGYYNGGHAHADALACTLSVAGRPLLIDPGTATYTMDATLRDRFRSSPMHNTVVVDGRSSSEPRGAFQWRSRADAQATAWHATTRCDYAEGHHDGYAPIRHTRAVLALEGLGWWIIDYLIDVSGQRAELQPDGGVQRRETRVEQFWHLDPVWRPALGPAEPVGGGSRVCQLDSPGLRLALATTAPLALMPAGSPVAVRSPDYGVVEPSPVLCARISAALPGTVAAFIAATAEVADGLSVERLELTSQIGAGWCASAFRARWRLGAVSLLSAVPATAAPGASAVPDRPWGTAELQTDGRLAAIIDVAGEPQEGILGDGSTLTGVLATSPLTLPGRVPLLRRPLGGPNNASGTTING